MITSGTTSASTKLPSELIPNIWRGIMFFGIVQSCITLSKQKHNRCATVTESDRYARSTEQLFRNKVGGIKYSYMLNSSSGSCTGPFTSYGIDAVVFVFSKSRLLFNEFDSLSTDRTSCLSVCGLQLILFASPAIHRAQDQIRLRYILFMYSFDKFCTDWALNCVIELDSFFSISCPATGWTQAERVIECFTQLEHRSVERLI
jgi:hypothetical protein